ncbi:uncharacterized protein LOC124939994 isoform X2 [Impatiens glandulifera]|uniref:uncharacterized protein LOC124939994 isoform X2 n=1 Tax=Impatiens glandulifera TaxID=253017 RepID=UPI001FB19BD1|nr:uncharacterized protein LOC124939994 isoform X2 [Impatiens glandulifera]
MSVINFPKPYIEVKMLVHSSAPDSVDAALSHVEKGIVCDWLPSTEPWLKSSVCGKGAQDNCGKHVVNNDLCSSSFPVSSSNFSTVGTVNEVSTPTLVYRRRKLQKQSLTLNSSKGLPMLSHCCFPSISSEALSMAEKVDNVGSHVESEGRSPRTYPVNCSSGGFVSKCSVGEDTGRALQLCENESCSSSKSNLDIGSSSLRTEVNDLGECSSSSPIVVENLQDDLSQKHSFISMIASQCLVQERSSKDCPSNREAIYKDNGCMRTCKVCGDSEFSQKMLICDQCEEAFHTRCCNPCIKTIPVDDWVCHTCFRNKYRRLKETSKSSSLNNCNEVRRREDGTIRDELSPIEAMLSSTEPHISNVRIGAAFQAELPVWSGPSINETCAFAGKELEMSPSEYINFETAQSSQSCSMMSSIGNWLQCRQVIKRSGGVEGNICGKWRRAPLFEVQTDNWECFQTFMWDHGHADCAVPQELDTDQVVKQLKYLEMLRHRLVVKRRRRMSNANE